MSKRSISFILSGARSCLPESPGRSQGVQERPREVQEGHSGGLGKVCEMRTISSMLKLAGKSVKADRGKSVKE